MELRKYRVPLTILLVLIAIFSMQANRAAVTLGVKTKGTIYIRQDGTVDPPWVPIQRDGDVYTFTDDIYESVVIERDNILVDGAGYTLKGAGKEGGLGLDLCHRSNVTLKNLIITNFEIGIRLYYSSGNTIVGNNATGNYLAGIYLYRSSSNKLASNNATSNPYGMHFDYSSGNTISYNTLTDSGTAGIRLACSRNTLYGNTAANNVYGISLYGSSDSTVYHNNFINNTEQVESYASANMWDDGYPSGGNYWSDYVDVDLFSGPYQNLTGTDGIWDHVYVIDADNRDSYPLVEPWTPLPRTIRELNTKIKEFGLEGEIDNKGIVKGLIAKLKVAQRLVDKEKTDEARLVLGEFVMQVQELSGIHITIEAAEILIKSAKYVMSHL